MLETATKNAEVNGPPQFQSFSHVSVPCRDLEEGIHFYTQVLRGKVRVKEAHFALIRIAGTDIGIGTEGCSHVERGAEYPHFAFFAGGEEMLQMKDWLTRCGVPSTNFWTRMGVEALMFFRDPSNNIIELYCEKGFKGAAELPCDRRAGTDGPLISSVSTTTNGACRPSRSTGADNTASVIRFEPRARIANERCTGHFAASRRGSGEDQRSAAASSAALASTQAVPATVSTCFQNGARVFR